MKMMSKKLDYKNYPKISIITCVYNGEKYISKLFDSVLDMDYPNIEHIVVDDGSTDNTKEIIERYRLLYECSNKSLVDVHQSNQGLGAATNVGLKMISGEFWTWINCDDWYKPDCLTTAMSKFKNNVDIVAMNRFKITYNSGEFTCVKTFSDLEEKNFSNNRKVRRLLFNVEMPPLHFLIRTKSFDSINPQRLIDPFRYNQDYQFIFTLFSNLNIVFAKDAFINFLYRKDSLFFVGASKIVKDGEYKTLNDPYIISGLKSYDYISIPDYIKKSQINLYKANIIGKQLYSYYQQNDYNSFSIIYHGSYLPLVQCICKKYKKFLKKKTLVIGTLLTIPFISRVFKKIIYLKRFIKKCR